MELSRYYDISIHIVISIHLKVLQGHTFKHISNLAMQFLHVPHEVDVCAGHAKSRHVD